MNGRLARTSRAASLIDLAGFVYHVARGDLSMRAFKQTSRREFLAGSLAVGAFGSRLTAAETRPSDAAAAKKDTWQIGCYTRPWAEHEYRVALDAIAEAGFKYVGLMTTKSPTNLVISSATTPEEAASVGEEVRKRGLQVANVYAGDFYSADLGGSAKALRRMIDNCAAAGSPGLMLAAPRPEAARQLLSDGRRLLQLRCHGQGRLERQASRGLNASGAQCREVIEYVGHRNFRLWYDPGNIYYYSNGRLDPVDDAATVGGLVVGMSVKDYLPPKSVDVTPGTARLTSPPFWPG